MVRKLATFLILLGMQSLVGQDSHNLYQQANKFFLSGEIEKALIAYEKVHPKTAIIWYNMALCYQQLNLLTQALAALQKAQKLGNSSLYYKAHQMECAMVQSYTVQEYIYAALVWMGKLCSYSIWYTILLVSWICILLAIFYPLAYKRMLMIVSTASFILCAALLIHMHYDQYVSYAIVKNSTHLYRGPGVEFSQCGNIEPVQKVMVQQTHKGWCKIMAVDKQGWLQNSSLIIVDALT